MKRSIGICVFMLCALGVAALSYSNKRWNIADDICGHCYQDTRSGLFWCAMCDKPFDKWEVVEKNDKRTVVEYYHDKRYSRCKHYIDVVYYNK